MNSIVLDLQKEAMDSNTELSDLLRKAYAVAKKLKNKEFENWVKLELNGYSEEIKPPEYRKVHGRLKFFDPYVGYVDYKIDVEIIHEAATTRYLIEAIAELEDLYKKCDSVVNIEINPKSRQIFRKLREDIVPEVLFVHVSQLKSIFDSVRNIILEWALKLEEDGILGENLNFSPEEKKIAHEHTITYNTIIQGSQVQFGEGNIQNIDNPNLTELKELLKSIKDTLNDLELNNTDKNELNVGIKTIESQLESKNPNQNIIKEAFKSIRNILEGCVSSAIAPVLIAGISKLIGF